MGNSVGVSVSAYNPTSLQPTQLEIRNLEEAITRLVSLDVNRAVIGRDIFLNTQGRDFNHMSDNAAQPLFQPISDQVFSSRPSWRSFHNLLDNYTAHTGVAEVVTAQEMQEQSVFLDVLLDSPIGQYLHNLLIAHNCVPADRFAFKSLLQDLWFGLYKREVHNDSSAFEHVFLGEISNGRVIGLHNWFKIYFEERAGRINYRGFIPPKGGGSRDPVLDATHFVFSCGLDWQGCRKDKTTMMIGTSPEFEIALWTVAYYLGQETTRVPIGADVVTMTTHKIQTRDDVRLGSCYIDY